MTSMTYPSGAVLNYQYDPMGRLSQITSPNYPESNPDYSITRTGAGRFEGSAFGGMRLSFVLP